MATSSGRQKGWSEKYVSARDIISVFPSSSTTSGVRLGEGWDSTRGLGIAFRHRTKVIEVFFLLFQCCGKEGRIPNKALLTDVIEKHFLASRVALPVSMGRKSATTELSGINYSKVQPLTPLYKKNADIIQYIKLASNSPLCMLCGAYLKTDASLIEHWVTNHVWSDLTTALEQKEENFNNLKVMNSQWKMDVLIAAAYLCPIPKCNSKSPRGVPAFLTQKTFYKHINYHTTSARAQPQCTPSRTPDVVLEEGKTDMMPLADTYFSDHPFWRPEEVAIFPDRDQKLVWLFHQ
ncbi:hypothetical protein BU17DRAFT_69332 [Hysterangium stoloniferum]|nr:hypothetical protein BU17DRAFT_69332 [Hysterangium stoloniferum]